MSTKLRKYLESSAQANATEAQPAFMATLTGDEAVHARHLAETEEEDEQTTEAGGFVDENGDGLCDNCGETEENCTCGLRDEDEEDGGDQAAEDENEDEDEDEENGASARAVTDRIADARAAERRRVAAILNLGGKFKMPAAWVSGTSPPEPASGP